jgi:drug/metabolite transporter (DMT)-like permease
VALSGASPITAAFWRYAYALPLLAALVLLRTRARAGFRTRRWIPLASCAGVFFTIDLVLWHNAISLVGAGPSTLLANTQVVWITIFGLVVLRERPGPVFWIALPALALGVWLLVGGGMGGIALEADRLGLLFGVGAGLAYSGALICVRAAQRRAAVQPETVLAVQISVAFIALLPLAFFDPTPLTGLPVASHLWLLLLGVGVQVLSWWAITSGIRRIPGYHGAVLLLAQPVTSVILGWWILGQALSVPRLVGALLVVAAIGLVVLRDNKS